MILYSSRREKRNTRIVCATIETRYLVCTFEYGRQRKTRPTGRERAHTAQSPQEIYFLPRPQKTQIPRKTGAQQQLFSLFLLPLHAGYHIRGHGTTMKKQHAKKSTNILKSLDYLANKPRFNTCKESERYTALRGYREGGHRRHLREKIGDSFLCRVFFSRTIAYPH